MKLPTVCKTMARCHKVTYAFEVEVVGMDSLSRNAHRTHVIARIRDVQQHFGVRPKVVQLFDSCFCLKCVGKPTTLRTKRPLKYLWSTYHIGILIRCGICPQHVMVHFGP